MQLDANQLIVLGLLGPALTFILRMFYEGFKKIKVQLPGWAFLVIVFGVSQALAYLWFPQAFPPFPQWTGDPSFDVALLADFLTGMAVAISALLGFGKLIYDALISRVKLPLRTLLKVK